VDVWCAAIGPAEGDALEQALEVFGEREGVERAGPADEATVRGSIETALTGESWLVMSEPRGPAAMPVLQDFARTIARATQTAVQLVASGTDPATKKKVTVLQYAAFEVRPDGDTRGMKNEAGDAFLKECPAIDDDAPTSELWGLLCSMTDTTADGLGPPFHFVVHKSAVTDPRIAALVAEARSALRVEVSNQPDGRTLVRLQLADGSRRLAYLRSDEAETFKRVIAGSG